MTCSTHDYRGRRLAVHPDVRSEILYGRDSSRSRVFVSSRMGANLDVERDAVVRAIKRTSPFQPWSWEENAPAGRRPSEEDCVGFARTSDALILLIAGKLTDIVYREFNAAREGGADLFIFIKDGSRIPADVKDFVREHQRGLVVTRQFANEKELSTLVTEHLQLSLVDALRHRAVSRLEAMEVSGDR